jgi:hypothetical protein
MRSGSLAGTTVAIINGVMPLGQVEIRPRDVESTSANVVMAGLMIFATVFGLGLVALRSALR